MILTIFFQERGTGDIKLLRHKINNTVRVVMRRDKTLKVCANHFITPDIRMNVHCGSDKAFNWSVFADFADEQMKQELLAIKFGNPQSELKLKHLLFFQHYHLCPTAPYPSKYSFNNIYGSKKWSKYLIHT